MAYTCLAADHTQHRRFRGVWHVFGAIRREHGFFNLYRGLPLCCLVSISHQSNWIIVDLIGVVASGIGWSVDFVWSIMMPHGCGSTQRLSFSLWASIPRVREVSCLFLVGILVEEIKFICWFDIPKQIKQIPWFLQSHKWSWMKLIEPYRLEGFLTVGSSHCVEGG